MAGYTRSIETGPAGTTWVNDTPRVAYQFHVAGINTCGTCYQYSEAVSNGPFPIPLHHGCRCRQSAVAPGAEAPRPFIDFREEIAALPHDQQVAVVGASAYKLLEAGVVKWTDVVTPSRVRTLREVVSLQRLSVKTLTAAGVRPRIAEIAHSSVNTPAHIAADAARREGFARLAAAGLKQEALVAELSARIAARVSVAEGATYTTQGGEVLRGIKAHRMPGSGGSNAEELAKLLGAYLAAKPKRAKKKPPVATAPVAVAVPAAAPVAPPYTLDTMGTFSDVDLRIMRDAIEGFPRATLDLLQKNGHRFVYAEKFADFDPHLAKQSPRGWGDLTWEHTDGCYNPPRKAMVACKFRRVGTGDPPSYLESYRRVGVMRHETGHGLDDALGDPSHAQIFRRAYDEDLATLPADVKASGKLDYYLQSGHAGPEEVFAESFGQLYGGGAGTHPIAGHFSRCTALVREWAEKGSL